MTKPEDPDHRSRTAGILLPAFSPRREGDLGIGDTLAMREWIDWAAEHGVGFLELLPINETGADNSPYSAISSVALEPLYLAMEPELVPGLEEKDLAAARAAISKALQKRRVDYPAVRRAKRKLLRAAWHRVEAAAKADSEFAAFRREEAVWLDEYVVFRWLMARSGNREAWDLWPKAYSTPEAAREFVASERKRNAEFVDSELMFHAWVQWLCFRQWREVRAYADQRGVKLMGDMPIGISHDSHDVFFRPGEFDLNWFGGAPPEHMFKHDRFIQQWGQNWGIPLYRWDEMEKNGWDWWRRRVEKLTEIFHIFRIDHVLGFYRIYAFPWHPRRNGEFLDLSPDQARELTGGPLPGWAPRPDDTPENKAANRADGDKRLRMILEAAGEAEVVAEDLGCVPDYVRPHLASLDIAGFRLPHWEVKPDGHVVPPAELDECAFATYATHDHDTIAAMWDGFRTNATGQVDGLPREAVDGARFNLRLLSEFAGLPQPADASRWPRYTNKIKWPLLDALHASRPRYAATMITDVFGMRKPFNRPGTVSPENWSLRLPWPASSLAANPELQPECQRLAESIRKGDRARS